MPLKKFVKLVPFLVVFPAFAAEPRDGPMDGFWGSRVSLGSYVNMSAEVEIVAGVGKLRFTAGGNFPYLRQQNIQLPAGFRFETDQTNLLCDYYFRMDGGTATEIRLDPSVGTARNGVCPDSPDIRFARTGLPPNSTLGLTFESPGIAFAYDVIGNLTPIFENQMAAVPQGFDVLGVSPGMARADIEAVLTGAGFQEVPEASATLEAPGWRSQAVTYVKDPGTTVRGFTDIVYVYYSADRAGVADTPEHAIYLGRQRHLEGDAAVAPDTLAGAFNDKYGTPKGPHLGNREYLRDGSLDMGVPPRTQRFVSCNAANRNVQVRIQLLPPQTGTEPRWATPRRTIAAVPNCGSLAEIIAPPSAQSGLVEQFTIWLHVDDLLLQDQWRRVSAAARAAIVEKMDQLEGASTGGGAAPRL